MSPLVSARLDPAVGTLVPTSGGLLRYELDDGRTIGRLFFVTAREGLIGSVSLDRLPSERDADPDPSSGY
jgi:hypothetical protein